MRQIFLSIVWIYTLIVSAEAQILPDSTAFREDSFLCYVEHTDSLNRIHYQVGTYHPNDSSEIHLPVYLRIVRQGVDKLYSLDTKYDPDMFSFAELSSDRFTVINGRYAFYVYDIQRDTLSRKLHPGLDQYEGEDAISGLYSGLTLFDKEQFLLGNVQGFGVFCYDISDPANPIELLQYAIKKTDEELPFYVFFYKTTDNLFDMLIAQPDTSSKSLVPRLYNRLKTVRYATQRVALDMDISKFPVPQPAPANHYLPQDYFSQISPVKKHTYTGKTNEFCSREQYEYENGIRYSFTDYGPCEQYGHGVTEIFIPNFDQTQAVMLILSGYQNPREILLEQASDKEIRFLWGFSTLKIIPRENGISIVDDVML